jgi:hypothetical protein
MTNQTAKLADAWTEDRWQIMRRAEGLRAEETRRIVSALARRIRSAFTTAAARGPAPEPVYIPRGPSSAIF